MGKCATPAKCQRVSRSQSLWITLQLLLALTVFNEKLTTVLATPLMQDGAVGSENSNDIPQFPADEAGFSEKRSWQSLQGSWGKRALNGLLNAVDPINLDSGAYLLEHMMPVLVCTSDPKSRYQLAYLTNVAAMESLMNQRRIFEYLFGRGFERDETALEETGSVDNIVNEKRAWKNMNAAWGKRRTAPTWNKFTGGWGKREPNWNNLKGMWGKRSSKDWQKLHGGWGKRSQQFGELDY